MWLSRRTQKRACFSWSLKTARPSQARCTWCSAWKAWDSRRLAIQTPNKGHHHLLIDAGPMQKGLVIPVNEKSLHFGKAQTEADVKLPPGDHTLTLQFGDGAHQSFGPEMSQTIKIHVK